MKKFLLIGCSNGLDLHRQFGHVFGDTNITYINLSFTGMGNRYITARLFEYIDDIGVPDYVYLQYTGLSRIDIPLDIKVKVPKYDYQKSTGRRNWVASGGRNGSWTSCDMLKRFFAYMYDTTSELGQYDLSLHEIFTGIELCKKLNIKYNWNSYYDYINPPNKPTKIEGIIDQFPNYIDMSNYIGDHPLNFAYKSNQIPEDGIHYNRSVGIQYLTQNKDKFNI
jgi:hypothetical protein